MPAGFIKGAYQFTIEQKKPGQKIISYSQLSRYQNCPLYWKLSYIDKIKEDKPNISLLFGTATHRTIQDYIFNIFENSSVQADNMDLAGMLKENMAHEYKQILEHNNNQSFTNQMEMTEHYKDGIEILEFLRRKRTQYFNTKNLELIAIEMPIYSQASEHNKNVYMNGFVDIILKDVTRNKFLIYDIKTSTRGWNKYQKKDKTKISQLIIYKKYLAKQFDVDINDIEVEYFIVKRKVDENALYPEKRITRFSPASGNVTVKRVSGEIDEFIKECFNEDGTYRIDKEYEAKAGKGAKNCRYCPFSEREDLCPKMKRTRK